MSTQLGEALHRLIHSYKSELRAFKQHSDFDLPITHIRTLKCIKRTPQCTALTVSRHLERDKSQVTRVIKELLESGYIEKQKNPRDNRSQLLLVTSHGDQALSYIREIEKRTLDKMTAGLKPSETEQFTHLIDTMIHNLSKRDSLT